MWCALSVLDPQYGLSATLKSNPGVCVTETTIERPDRVLKPDPIHVRCISSSHRGRVTVLLINMPTAPALAEGWCITMRLVDDTLLNQSFVVSGRQTGHQITSTPFAVPRQKQILKV